MSNINKIYDYKSNNQVWRILITPTEKLIIETRDTENKEVFFNCFDAFSGKEIFTDFQLEEKFWIGIEAIHNDVIFFHKYAKPDMPGHKQIIAFDIESQNELWKTDEYVFLFVHSNIVYSYKQMFEGRKFFALDYKSGEVIKEFGDDYIQINSIKYESQKEDLYKDYIFPEKFDSNSTNLEKPKIIIEDYTKNTNLAGEIEYNLLNDILVFNYHFQDENEKLTNTIVIYSLEENKELLIEQLNTNANAYVPDSFFAYKNLLFILKEKNTVKVYKY